MPIAFEKFFKAKGISLPIARAWRSRYGLPVIQIGRRLYVDENDFAEWVAAHRQTYEEPAEKSIQIALPKKCRKSNLASKIRRIY